MEEKKRTALWDNLRFLLIVAVTVGHFVNIKNDGWYLGVYMFVYSFHMPLFMFVSGLFHKNTNIIRRIVAYLLIYILFKGAIFGVKCFYGKQEAFEPLTESGAPWFMFVLAVYILLGYLVRNLNKKAVLIVSIVLALAAGYCDKIGYFLCSSRVVGFFPFYYLGMVINREKVESAVKNRKVKVVSGIVLAGWLALCLIFPTKVSVFRPFFLEKKSYPAEHYAFGALWRAGCYIISTVLGFAVIAVVPDRRIKGVTKWGSRTIQVYFWHRIFLYILGYSGIQSFFYKGGNVMRVLWIGVAVLTSVVMSFRIFEFPTMTIMNMARKKKVIKSGEKTADNKVENTAGKTAENTVENIVGNTAGNKAVKTTENISGENELKQQRKTEVKTEVKT